MSMLKTTAAAAFLEIAATYFLIDFVNSTAQVVVYLALHLVASILLASAVMPVLPERYREPRQWVAGLLFSFAFFMPPLLGILGVLSAIVITPLLKLVRRKSPSAAFAPRNTCCPSVIRTYSSASPACVPRCSTRTCHPNCACAR